MVIFGSSKFENMCKKTNKEIKQRKKRQELLLLRGKVKWEGNLDELRTDSQVTPIVRGIYHEKL